MHTVLITERHIRIRKWGGQQLRASLINDPNEQHSAGTFTFTFTAFSWSSYPQKHSMYILIKRPKRAVKHLQGKHTLCSPSQSSLHVSLQVSGDILLRSFLQGLSSLCVGSCQPARAHCVGTCVEIMALNIWQTLFLWGVFSPQWVPGVGLLLFLCECEAENGLNLIKWPLQPHWPIGGTVITSSCHAGRYCLIKLTEINFTCWWRPHSISQVKYTVFLAYLSLQEWAKVL